MNNLLKRLREIAAKVLFGEGRVLKSYVSPRGRVPDFSFKTQMKCYLKDVATRSFVDSLAVQTVGMGFYTTCAKETEYAEAPQAKEVVDRFCEENNLDGLLQASAKEIVATGNCIWEKLQPESLKYVRRIPIWTFDRIITNEFGEFFETHYTKKRNLKLGFKQRREYGGGYVDAARALLFRWNPVDETGWGCGLMRTLLETYSWIETSGGKTSRFTRRSAYEIKAVMDEMLPTIIEKFGGPMEVWTAKNPKTAENLNTQLSQAPKRGARFVVEGSEVDIKTPPLEPRARFESYIDYLFNQFCLGGQSPLPKLFTTPGFTEASANAAVEVADRLIMPLQRLIKRVVERNVFDPLIMQAGFDPAKAAVRLNWGTPETPELTIENVLKAFELGAVRSDEARKNLAKFGVELWETEEVPAS